MYKAPGEFFKAICYVFMSLSSLTFQNKNFVFLHKCKTINIQKTCFRRHLPQVTLEFAIVFAMISEKGFYELRLIQNINKLQKVTVK